MFITKISKTNWRLETEEKWYLNKKLETAEKRLRKEGFRKDGPEVIWSHDDSSLARIYDTKDFGLQIVAKT